MGNLGDNTIYSLLPPTMAGVDHTKLLMAYVDIFQGYEERYREVPKAKRDRVIKEIATEIKQRAEESQAKILYGDGLHAVCHQLPSAVSVSHACLQQIEHFYTNHKWIQKGDDDPPVKAGKHWTARTVINFLFKKEIEEWVNKHGKLLSQERISVWSKELKEFMNELGEEEVAQYDVKAKLWNEQGPPDKIKRR